MNDKQLPNKLRKLRLERGLTQQQLADSALTTRAQIDKLEKGARRLTVDWIIRLARALVCDPRDMITISPSDLPTESSDKSKDLIESSTLPANIPLYGTISGADTSKIFFTETPIDSIARPFWLANVPDAYAIQMSGEEMIPMYRPRQTIFVHPWLVPTAGCGVALLLDDNSVLVREFISDNKTDINVRTYNPRSQQIKINKIKIKNIHRIVGTMDN